MNKIITVTLETKEKEGNKTEILKFQFDNPIYIDLTSDDPQQLKAFFIDLLSEFEKSQFNLSYDKGGRSDLFAEVAEKYINNLNSELKGLYTKFPLEIDRLDDKE